MGRKRWTFFFDKRTKVRRILIIWEALARVFKSVYTYSTQIGTALGAFTKASIRYTYSILVKRFTGSEVGVKARATYAGISAALKGRAHGLTVRTVYTGIAAYLKGRPYGLLARMSYSEQVKVGARLGASVRTSYAGTTVALKGRPTSFKVKAEYSATSKQVATSDTRFGTSVSYSASVTAHVNPPWLPRFDLSVNKDTVNTFPGSAYSITFTVVNTGGLAAQAEVSVWDVNGMSKDRFVIELAPRASYSKAVEFVAPQEPGTYYVTARVKNLFTGRVNGFISVRVNVAPAQ